MIRWQSVASAGHLLKDLPRILFKGLLRVCVRVCHHSHKKRFRNPASGFHGAGLHKLYAFLLRLPSFETFFVCHGCSTWSTFQNAILQSEQHRELAKMRHAQHFKEDEAVLWQGLQILDAVNVHSAWQWQKHCVGYLRSICRGRDSALEVSLNKMHCFLFLLRLRLCGRRWCLICRLGEHLVDW